MSRFNLIFFASIIISFKGVLLDNKTSAKDWRGAASRFNESYISGFAYHFHVIRAGGSKDVDEEESPAKRTRRARAGSNY